MLKTFLTAAVIALTFALISVAASEMANASNSELLLKLMAFISLIVADVYMFVLMFKDNDNDDNHNN